MLLPAVLLVLLVLLVALNTPTVKWPGGVTAGSNSRRHTAGNMTGTKYSHWVDDTAPPDLKSFFNLQEQHCFTNSLPSKSLSGPLAHPCHIHPPASPYWQLPHTHTPTHGPDVGS